MKIIRHLVIALACLLLIGNIHAQTAPAAGGSAAGATNDATGNPLTVNSINRRGSGCNLGGTGACEYSSDIFPAPRGIGSEHDQDVVTTGIYYGKGLSINGNQWRTQQLRTDTLLSYSRGIHQGFSQLVNCYSVGDCAGIYSYLSCAMGSNNGSDEGCENSLHVKEIEGYDHGTVTGGAADAPELSNPTAGPKVVIDGTWLLDITQGKLSGKLTGASAVSPVLSGQPALPVSISTGGSALPVSSAIGVLTAPIIGNQQLNALGSSATATLTLQSFHGGAHAFTVSGAGSGNVCFGGTPEQAPVTAVRAPASGKQTITVTVRYNHYPGEFVYQGGVCGSYLSFPDDLALTGQRFVYPALGSTTGKDLLVSFPTRNGNLAGDIPRVGNSGETLASAFTLYPGAEIVANNSTGVGPLIVEPHNFTYAVKDAVEDPHHPAAQMRGLQMLFSMATPPNYSTYSSGLSLVLQGAGINAAFKPFVIRNANPSEMYVERSGKLVSPNVMDISGAFQHGFNFRNPPANSLFYFTDAPFGSVNGRTDLFYWNYNGSMLSMTNNSVNGFFGELNYNHAESASVLCTPLCTSSKFMADQGGNVTAERVTSKLSNGAGFQGVLYTPASSSAPCVAGQFADDANYHYVCVAKNTWKRVALSSF